jgi:tRNA(adenine34) deaminase
MSAKKACVMPLQDAIDKAMMARCIALSRAAVSEGEYPFATVIALGDSVVAESINRARRDKDVTRHAEIIALSAAQSALSRSEMRRASLYTNVEPCAMCAYCIREAWVGRVVFALSSPVMGGASKWNILRDEHLSGRIPLFGPPPELVSGYMHWEAGQAWNAWNPAAWQLAKVWGVLAGHAPGEERGAHVLPPRARPLWQRILIPGSLTRKKWTGAMTRHNVANKALET